jgi:natural product precursor
MKKVNLKGTLNLKKETMSKLEMTNLKGGATIQAACTKTCLEECVSKKCVLN